MAASPHIPGLRECLRLMVEYGMLGNIRRHSLVVARLAMQLQEGLSAMQPGKPQAAKELVLAGALLHDIAKTLCLNTNCDHAKVGADICRKEGYPEVAHVVGQHVRLSPFDEDRYKAGCFTALELVHYADKRVRHHVVVSLDERREYIIERYGNNSPERYRAIEQHFQQCAYLERLLFRWLPFSPQELGIL
ncbi:MAG: HDIG domain-containing protein [Desulfobulbaceae bacterium]|nr:HDIG domain-containing protein [Desulfobulbaceae bacterium]